MKGLRGAIFWRGFRGQAVQLKHHGPCLSRTWGALCGGLGVEKHSSKPTSGEGIAFFLGEHGTNRFWGPHEALSFKMKQVFCSSCFHVQREAKRMRSAPQVALSFVRRSLVEMDVSYWLCSYAEVLQLCRAGGSWHRRGNEGCRAQEAMQSLPAPAHQ